MGKLHHSAHSLLGMKEEEGYIYLFFGHTKLDNKKIIEAVSLQKI